MRTLLRHVANPLNKRLLETGSAYVCVLQVARGDFMPLEGIDISEDAAAYARSQFGLQVTACDFLDYDVGDKVDVLCVWDTIEHLHHPDQYPERAAAYMDSGGVIAMTTGDIGSWVARWRGAIRADSAGPPADALPLALPVALPVALTGLGPAVSVPA